MLIVLLSACVGCWNPADDSAHVVGVDIKHFAREGIVSSSLVDCTLSGGTRTKCHAVTIRGVPANHDIGPFCPRSISDGPDVAGTWIEGGEVHDLSGEFVRLLADFYDDEEWALFDPSSGAVRVTETKEACEGAARPNVAPRYQNHCVECDLKDIGDTTLTVHIPATPIKRTRPTQIDRHGKVGVALSGVVFDPPAPVEAILAAHTIAAFDDCGGHINPNTGYHYHSAAGCSTTAEQADGHAALLGYAMDGFGMYAQRDGAGEAPADLDTCRGHEDEPRGYHYHVEDPGKNSLIDCFMGEPGRVAR